MGDILAPTHLLIILLIILVIFGPSKLGDIGGVMGKAVRDFKKAINEDDPTKSVAKTDDPKPVEVVKPDKIS